MDRSWLAPRRRRCAAIVALAFAVAAIVHAIRPAHASATTCVGSVVYRGNLYVAVPMETEIGDAIGTGVVPACEFPYEGRDGTPVTVSRIPRVDPRVAVSMRGRVFLRSGYFPQNASFPVRDPKRLPPHDATADCTTGIPYRLAGRVHEVSWYGSFTLVVDHAERRLPPLARGRVLTRLRIDRQTRFTALDRHGLPHVSAGQRLWILAVPCAWKLVAQVVAPTRATLDAASGVGERNRDLGAAAVAATACALIAALSRRRGDAA